MKNSIKTLVVIALLVIAGNTFAQNSATASATANATIVCPMTLSSTANLNFGKITNDADGSNVVITPAGVVNYNAGALAFGGAGGAGTVNPAAFLLGGQSGYTYAVTLPTSFTMGALTVDNFTSDASGTIPVSAYGGCTTVPFHVGATLTIPAGASGTWSQSFSVTCAYN